MSSSQRSHVDNIQLLARNNINMANFGEKTNGRTRENVQNEK